MDHDKSVHTAITQVDVDDGERGGGERDRLVGSYPLASGSAPYATIEYLKRYVPSLSPDYNTGQTTREWIGQYDPYLKPREDAKRRGDPISKRAEMLRNQALVAVFVVALNVGIFAWAIISYAPDNHGVGTFYAGRCPTASAVNSAARVVLNVLDTGRGYSVLGTVLAIRFEGLVVAIMLINSGVRRYRGIPDGFQLMAYNSSGIQAICQRPERDGEAGFFPIRMGVTAGAGEGCLN
jgi:uncharacterized protein DUF6536